MALPKIESVKSRYDAQIAVKDTNNQNISPDYDSSLICNFDYTENKTKIDSIISTVGKEAYDTCRMCISFIESAQMLSGDTVNSIKSELLTIPNGIQNSLDLLAKVMDEQIKPASETVYNDKKNEYKTNDDSIVNSSKTFGSHSISFDNNAKNYNDAKSRRDSAESGSDEYKKAQDDMNRYEQNAQSDYDVCDTCVDKIVKCNNDNIGLLNDFLKRI